MLIRDVAAEFTGRVTDAELPGFVQGADVVCSPAVGGESFGIVLLEAMAAGAPVLASDLAAFRQVLDDGRLGELFEPGDAGALAAQALTLLSDKGLRDTLRETGQLAVRRYDWEILTSEILAVYELVASR